ncbi:MAG TPA: branched-chain amino acid ABC transporter permease [Candidatus Dormibacteraeota bacterium]|nr:branched-chain amino acid ABC transporter permease [Candidatus Dormibacteraeota bacterium]
MRWAPLAAALLVAPLVLQDAFYQRMLALVLLSALASSAWNIVGGYAGQVSFGHAIFFGAGAYLPALVYTHRQAAPTLGIPVGVALAVVIAIVIGMPTFRLRGHYFSMATIAVAELVRILVSNWPFMGAAIGLQGPASPRSLWDLTFRSSVPYYYILLGVLVALLAVTYKIERSRMGYYLRAICAGEQAARSLGVPVRRYKLYAFILSAAFTALAGSLYVLMIGFVDPDSGLGILVSVQIVIVAALGGAATLFGPLLGAAILIPLQQMANALFGGGGTGLTYIFYGGIIILLCRFEPGGLLALLARPPGAAAPIARSG